MKKTLVAITILSIIVSAPAAFAQSSTMSVPSNLPAVIETPTNDLPGAPGHAGTGSSSGSTRKKHVKKTKKTKKVTKAKKARKTRHASK